MACGGSEFTSAFAGEADMAGFCCWLDPVANDPQRKFSLPLNHSDHVRDLFVSYSETLLSQVQQTVACQTI
jgi:hypothetical protein